MSKAVPWSIKGVDVDAREAAREAARRAGMSVGDWLNSIIAEQASEMGVDVEDIGEEDRLEAVTARLASITDQTPRRARRADRREEAEEPLRRRAVAPRVRGDVRETAYSRPVAPRVEEDDEDQAPKRDPEALLDAAVAALERSAKLGAEKTTAAISEVARRLEDIEERLANPQSPPEPGGRAAIASLEARIEALTRRGDIDHGPRRNLRELQRRLDDMVGRLDARTAAPAPVAPQPEFERIETKLNRLIDTMSAPPAHPPAQPAPSARRPASPATEPARAAATSGVVAQHPQPELERIETKLNRLIDRMSAPPAQPTPSARRPASPAIDPARAASIGDAIARITRRQRDLDGDTRVVSPSQPAPALDFAALQKDVAALSARVEETRREVIDRDERWRVAQPKSREGALGFDLLSKQINDMTLALGDLAPRHAVSSLEGAIHELGQRVEMSRGAGAHETILRPIEDLAADMRRSLADIPSHQSMETIEREIRAVGQKIEQSRGEGVDARVLANIQAQFRDVRDMLQAVAARPAPFENIERQIAHLTDRVETLSRRGADGDVGSFDRSVGEIRSALEQTMPSGMLDLLANRVEELSRKIDDAVAQSNATDQFDDLAQRIDDMRKSVVARPEPRVSNVDTSALEKMMLDLAGKLDQPKPAAADTRRLEDMVRSLGAKLETIGAPSNDMRLVEALHGQIERLADTVERSGLARADAGSIDDLKREMARIAEYVEASPARMSDDAIGAVQRQLVQLSSRLDRVDESARVLVGLEGMIGDLAHRLEEQHSLTAEIAETAARAAARDTLAEALSNRPDAAPESVSREIADLRSLQDESDRRAHSTLTAVHQTLEKVVDRLAMLEDEIGEARPTPLLASGPPPVFTRPPQPAETAEKAAPPPPPVSVAPPVPPPPREPAALPRASTPFLDGTLDELIEPGSGFAPGRRGSLSADMAERDADKPAEQSAQASFIALARRAQQAASSIESRPSPQKSMQRLKAGSTSESALTEARARAQAAHLARVGDVGADDSDGEGGGPLARVKRFVTARRRPLLLGAAGLVIIVFGSAQVARLFQASPPRPQVLDLTNQKAPRRAPDAAAGKPADPPAVAMPSPGPTPTAPGGATLESSPASEPAATAAAPRFTQPNAALSAPLDTAPVSSINPSSSGKIDGLRAAANAGNPAAQFELGQRYADGRGIARDARQAMDWFTKAAQRDVAPAEYRLGSLYERGVGADRDLKRARDWYLRAAQAGNVRAMHNMAVLSAEGVDGKPDYATAATWFSKAAEYGVRDSQYNLAILYARGLGVDQDLTKSWAWFSIAAAQGDEDSAKKQQDVSGRLDSKQLAAAKAIVAAYSPRTPEKTANEVDEPVGGWDPPATADQRRAPPAKLGSKAKTSSL